MPLTECYSKDLMREKSRQQGAASMRDFKDQFNVFSMTDSTVCEVWLGCGPDLERAPKRRGDFWCVNGLIIMVTTMIWRSVSES